MRSAVRNWRVESRQMTRFTSRSARRAAMSSKLMPPRPRRGAPRLAAVGAFTCSILADRHMSLHAGDQLLDPLVDAAVRVLAQHGALGLVVQLEVHPVDGEVAAPLLRPADEIAAQLRPRGLRRDALRLEDREIGDHA